MKRLIVLMSLLLVMFSSVSLAEVNDSVLLLLRLDEGKGNVVKDISKYKNDGMIIGGNWTDGKSGKAIRFNKSTDRIEVVNTGTFDFGQEINFTIEFWLKVGSTSERKFNYLFSTRGYPTGAQNPGISIGLTNGFAINVTLADGRNRVDLVSDKYWLNDNKWHHIVVIADRKGKGSLYIDGKCTAEKDISEIGDINNISFPLQFGGDSTNKGEIDISIDEIRIDNCVRNDDLFLLKN